MTVKWNLSICDYPQATRIYNFTKIVYPKILLELATIIIKAVGTCFQYKQRLQYSVWYYARITAEVSQIHETLIQWEQFSPTSGTLQFVHTAIFMSFTCTTCNLYSSSVSPIHVPPIRVLKHCDAHINKINKYIIIIIILY